MKNICIIPARGGSKRIPRKNIKTFMGKPIIAYSIEAALQSGLFDEVMVSTDDEEIAEIACGYGAKVPFMRSAETSNDYAGTADVILEVLEMYKERGREFDTVCCIYSTAPFVTPERLREAYGKMNSEIDSVFTCIHFYCSFAGPDFTIEIIAVIMLPIALPSTAKTRNAAVFVSKAPETPK